MHFKCVVILCALYFVTVTQSMGLNEEQVKNIVKIFGKQKKSIDLITLELCKKNNFDFEHKRGRTNAQKVQDLLVYMAGKDKHLDNWKLQSISSFEVQMYVGLFNKFDPWFDYSGLLNNDEVKEVVKALTLEEDVKKQLVDEIKKIFKVLMKDSTEDSLILTTSETMSAPYFLMAFLKVKPKGRGLNKHHVQELIHFHKNNKINGDQIDPVAISKFIKKLSLVQEEHGDVLVFDSRRKTPFQLQELLLVLAEYNKGASEENGPVYSTDSVRDLLLHFSNYDVDKNGLLSKEELKKIQEPRYQIEDVDTTFKELDTEDDEHLYITEFFMAVFVERDRKNAIKD